MCTHVWRVDYLVLLFFDLYYCWADQSCAMFPWPLTLAGHSRVNKRWKDYSTSWRRGGWKPFECSTCICNMILGILYTHRPQRRWSPVVRLRPQMSKQWTRILKPTLKQILLYMSCDLQSCLKFCYNNCTIRKRVTCVGFTSWIR